MFLFAGGIMIPFVLLIMAAVALRQTSIPVALSALSVGLGCLVAAKWQQYRKGTWLSFGPQKLSPRGRKLYWSAYVLIVCGIVLTLAAVPFL